MTCGQFRVGQSRRRPRHGRLRRHAAAIRRNDPAFKHYIADRARTDIRCFPSINSAGTLRGGLAGPIIHTPEVVDVELLVTQANAHPRLVRGFGEIDAETGAVSRWDVDVVRIAREASDRTALRFRSQRGSAAVSGGTPAPDEPYSVWRLTAEVFPCCPRSSS